jgi:hypothetical protein
MRKSRWMYALRLTFRARVLVASALLAGCGPTAHIPTRPIAIASTLPAGDPAVLLAHALAPVLYLQRDEWFRLERVVAVLHPNRPIIGYYLLWGDDVQGAWLPFTKATDEEIVWVGYDPSGAPTDLWTYWHGKVLHADWRGRDTPAVDVQWGKHGLLPRGVVESDLPRFQTLNAFYAFHQLGIFDILLGRFTRRGPSGFFHSYGRYRDFTHVLRSGDAIDVVVRSDDPSATLAAVFGTPYSRKPLWP